MTVYNPMFQSLPCALTQSGPVTHIPFTPRFRLHQERQFDHHIHLLIEDGYYEHGIRDRIKLTWFRWSPNGFRRLKSVEFETSLDYLPVQVKDQRVTYTAILKPHAFETLAADSVLGCRFTWGIPHGRPALLTKTFLEPRLHAVDQAIWHSWHAKHPTSLQRRLRHYWPKPDEFDDWTEKRIGQSDIVTINHEVEFRLHQEKIGGWTLNEVHPIKPPTSPAAKSPTHAFSNRLPARSFPLTNQIL